MWRRHRTTDERIRSAEVFDIAVPPNIEGQLRTFSDFGVTAVHLEHPRDTISVRVVPGVGSPERLVVRARRPVPLEESLIGRPASATFPDMPLPVRRACVPSRGQQVAERFLPLDQSPPAACSERHTISAGSHSMTACQERRTRRGALRFGSVIREPESFLCELVDTFGPRAAERAPAVATELGQTRDCRRERTTRSAYPPSDLPHS